MSATLNLRAPSRLELWAETAADLMMANPMSIRDNITVREAAAALIDHGYTAAPVIDEAGRPVGVLSRTDILVHDRTASGHAPAYYDSADLASAKRLGPGFHVEEVDTTLVSDIMTPTVFSVSPDTCASKVIEDMLALKVHRLFVVDTDGTLVGTISALDVVRHLRPGS
jgi:CBS domain-containing protein